jgi:hypothetical protein
MTKDSFKSARTTIYECSINENLILKGKWIKGYYGILPLVQLLGDNPLESAIINDLKDKKITDNDFDYPVLVISYYLGSGNPPKPLLKPQGALTIKSAGGLIRLKRMVSIPVRRKKIPKTEKWQAVIDKEGNVIKIEGNKLIPLNNKKTLTPGLRKESTLTLAPSPIEGEGNKEG